MHRVLAVDILTDRDVQGRVALWQLVALAVGVAGALVLAFVGGYRPTGWAWWVALVAGYIASLPVHELVHAAFFKLFGRTGTKVRFGFSSGMLYAGCPGERFGRAQFRAILLAPFALLSLVYLVIGLATGDALLAWCLFVLHGAGCMGDLYFVRTMAAHPEADLCEDTDRGFALWSSAEDGEAGELPVGTRTS